MDHGIEEITKDLPVFKPTTMYDLQLLRNDGLREATLNQVTWENRKRLAYIEYSNGSRRINIWSK